MEYAFHRAYLKRGCVFLFHEFDFHREGFESQPKYCVLMEDGTEEFDDIVVFLSTKNTTHIRMPWHVDFPVGQYEFWKLFTRVDCRNWFVVKTTKLFSRKKCKPVGFLTEEDINKILDASLEADNIPDNIRIRLYDY